MAKLDKYLDHHEDLVVVTMKVPGPLLEQIRAEVKKMKPKMDVSKLTRALFRRFIDERGK